MIDTHCHLTFPDFEGRLDETMTEAHEAGVAGAITVSTSTGTCLDGLALATARPDVWCTAGVHPLYADRDPLLWEHLATVARHERCVAFGELGLDNHYDHPPRDLQRHVLETQLAFILSLDIDLPVVLHCRKAFEDLIPILRSTPIEPERFVFHCFTGGPDDMRLVLDFGAWVSFTGVLTYRNAPEVREAASMIPFDRVMVETDAPFLSPDPVRGERPCRPAFVMHTARTLAKVHHLDFDEAHDRLNANVRTFYGVG